ncbi:MAG TPA: HAD-IC family P-type ATPase [Erysipelotrichaceae bacterium]|nr:HAD-IC family P-type ATPase [Erysipelotrichaceae bacterium]
MYVNMRSKKNSNTVRYNPSPKEGLYFPEIIQRNRENLVNKNYKVISKSSIEIVLSNIFNLYNLLLCSVAAFLLCFEVYYGFLLVGIAFLNTSIGLFEDVRSRLFLRKIKSPTQSTVGAIREGRAVRIDTNKVVLDDVLIFERNSQICVDGIIIGGRIGINESSATGKTINVYKGVGEKVYSGTCVVDGRAFVRAEKVGASSFINDVKIKANHIKRPVPETLHSYRQLFRIVGVIVVIVIAFVLLNFYIQNKLTIDELRTNGINSLAGSLIGIIPSGLFLFSSIALMFVARKLAKNKTKILDLYNIENLSKVNTICVDKTGTITDGSVVVKRTMIISPDVREEYIAQMMSNLLIATHEHNSVVTALRKIYDLQLSAGINEVLPFDNKNNYFGASFKGNKTLILGDPEFMPLKNKIGVLNLCEEHIKEGNRVLVLGEGNEPIVDDKFNGKLTALAIFVIKDCVREEVFETLRWFDDRGTTVKVISGDNAQLVSTVAQEVGIKHATKFISLENMPLERVKEIATRYTIFGNATAEQKEAIILALKEAGSTVAMIGDGINDVLALKHSDCSIAMATGSNEAKNVSQIILEGSSFSKLPEIVNEGRRVLNNLERITSLFAVKSIFALFLTIVFSIYSLIIRDISYQYPFAVSRLFLWEFFISSCAILFLVLEKSDEQTNNLQLGNVFKKNIPFAVTAAGVVLIFFILQQLQEINSINFGIYNKNTTVTMSAIAIGVLSIIHLYKICIPLTKYRRIVVCSFAGVNFLVLGISALVTYITNKTEPFLQMPYLDMSGPSYFITFFITALAASIYLFVDNLLGIKKGEFRQDEN